MIVKVFRVERLVSAWKSRLELHCCLLAFLALGEVVEERVRRRGNPQALRGNSWWKILLASVETEAECYRQ